MLPTFYQTYLENNLSQVEYLLLQILINRLSRTCGDNSDLFDIPPEDERLQIVTFFFRNGTGVTLPSYLRDRLVAQTTLTK